MATQITQFTLCEGEQVVRTFEITRLKRWFAEDAVGYLTITNQRVVYHSQAKSVTGESNLISEMPLDDVAGIGASMSASFNWIFYIILAVILYFANQIIFGVLPNFLTHWILGLILMLPYGVMLLFETNIFNAEFKEQALKNLSSMTASSPLKDKGASFYRPIFWVLFIIGADLVAFNIVYSPRISYTVPWLSYILVLGAALLIYRLVFGRFRIFSMRITSKTAIGSGIFIEGNPLAKILSGDKSAAQTLQAGPGHEADEVMRELGAMLTDIRLMGDLGIQKWSRSTAS